MPKPKCPRCGSQNVVPSLAKNSHDNCVACGYSDFVAKFYEVAEHHKPGDRVQTNGHFGEEPKLSPTVAPQGVKPTQFHTVKASDPIMPDDAPAHPFTQRTAPFPDRRPYWWEKD